MGILRYVIAYFVFSLLGWIWESIYCTLKERKWQNRGFLYGPLCPIYGFGSLLCVLYADLAAAGLIRPLPWWGMFIVGFFVSGILEYPTSYILEKQFHARWWDYSSLPLNLHGRTSVLTSLGFGLAAIVIADCFLPFFEGLYAQLNQWQAALLAMILVAIHSADFTLTLSHLSNFQRSIDELENAFQSMMTEAVDHMFEIQGQFYGKTLSRIASFRMSEAHNQIAERIISTMRNSRNHKGGR